MAKFKCTAPEVVEAECLERGRNGFPSIEFLNWLSEHGVSIKGWKFGRDRISFPDGRSAYEGEVVALVPSAQDGVQVITSDEFFDNFERV